MILSKCILCFLYLCFFSMFIHFYQLMYAFTQNEFLKTLFIGIALLVSGFTYDCLKTIFTYNERKFKVFENRNKALFLNFSIALLFITLGQYLTDLAIDYNKAYFFSLFSYLACLFFMFSCQKNIDELLEFV